MIESTKRFVETKNRIFVELTSNVKAHFLKQQNIFVESTRIEFDSIKIFVDYIQQNFC